MTLEKQKYIKLKNALTWSQSVTCGKGKGTFNQLFCYNVIQGYGL